MGARCIPPGCWPAVFLKKIQNGGQLHTRVTGASQVRNVYKINIDIDAQSLLIHFVWFN